MKKQELKQTIKEWEQFQQANWYESEVIDVEAVLLEQFCSVKARNTLPAPISEEDLDKLAKIATEDYPEHRAMYEAFFRQGFRQALSQQENKNEN